MIFDGQVAAANQWVPDINSVLLIAIGAVISIGVHSVRKLARDVEMVKKHVSELMAWLFGPEGKGQGFADRVIRLENQAAREPKTAIAKH